MNFSASSALILTVVIATTLSAQTVVDFGDVALSTPPATVNAGGGVYYNGSDGAGGFTSRGVGFVSNYNADWGSWDGWAYSTVGDTTTPGFDNQYASFAGGGHGDSTFAVGFAGWGLTLTLPAPSDLHSVFLTNGSYPGLSMQLGDDFAKKFGGIDGSDPDYLLLTMTGKDIAANELGTVEFYLADFRSTDPAGDYIVDTWAEVDLSGLGSGVLQIDFSMSSSDNGDWGMNTPSYFMLDDLSLSISVPEPSSVSLLFGSIAALFGLRRRRR